jgi:hypothetical protein
LIACSSGSNLQGYLGDRYQAAGGSGPDREYRAPVSFNAVDAAVTNKFEPLESIRANDGTFLRYDDNQYMAITPAAAGSAILLGPTAGRAFAAFQDHGGSAVADDERGGGPGEGK